MKEELRKIITTSVKKTFPNVEMPNFTVEYAEEKFGDFSTNAAMILTKTVGEAPEEIANKIVAEISKEEIFASVEVVKPGFINFKMPLPFWQQKISEIIETGESYGKSDLGSDLKVNIEFISANPTGPLTLGNGRGGYSGDTLARVFEYYGASVEREYYINDCGAQILSLGHSVLKDDDAVYLGEYINSIGEQIKSTDPHLAGEEAAAIITEEYIKKTIEKMGIKFNRWFSEKRLFEDGKVSEMIEKLKSLDLVYEKEGAIWLKTSAYGDDKDRVIVTSEGEHTYFVSDIAYHYDKIKRGYNILIDFWGADHHGYIGRLKAAVEVLRREEKWEGKLEILIAQLVKLVSKGQEIKMSKRLGTYITLDELIDEVGPDAARFFFLERALSTHMDFNLDLAKEHSEKNPVYYVQYAYARIASILAKSKIPSGIQNQKSKISNGDIVILKEPAEIALIKQLTKLPEIVSEIVGDYQIQKLPFYAVALANTFHKFYECCPVLQEDEKLQNARLTLLLATQIVLKNTLNLIGISAPEKM